MKVREIPVKIYPDGRMTAENASAYLGLSEKTLATMRSKGTGPKYIKIGRVFYYEDDLKDWLSQQVRVTSTAEYDVKSYNKLKRDEK